MNSSNLQVQDATFRRIRHVYPAISFVMALIVANVWMKSDLTYLDIILNLNRYGFLSAGILLSAMAWFMQDLETGFIRTILPKIPYKMYYLDGKLKGISIQTLVYNLSMNIGGLLLLRVFWSKHISAGSIGMFFLILLIMLLANLCFVYLFLCLSLWIGSFRYGAFALSLFYIAIAGLCYATKSISISSMIFGSFFPFAMIHYDLTMTHCLILILIYGIASILGLIGIRFFFENKDF